MLFSSIAVSSKNIFVFVELDIHFFLQIQSMFLLNEEILDRTSGKYSFKHVFNNTDNALSIDTLAETNENQEVERLFDVKEKKH